MRLKKIFFAGLVSVLVASPALSRHAAAAAPQSTLVVELSAAPADRPQLRSLLAGEQAQRLDGLRRQGLLQGYKLFFNRYADANRWDGMEVLTFSDGAAVSRWAALERTSPAGLSPAALRLVTHIVETPAEGMRRGGSRGNSADAPTLVIPYQVVVPSPQYLTYVDTYVVPQFDGWIAEGVLDSYEIQLSRFPAGRPWASLILLRYHDNAALERRDATTALVRRRLAENPQWKAASDSKTAVRTEQILSVADQLAGGGSGTVKVRPAFLRVHRWFGLTIGLIVMVSAFTGAGMAFRNQLDPQVYPQLFKASQCAHPLPLQRLVRSAKAAKPKGKLVYIRVFPAGAAPSAVRFAGNDTVFVDRCTGLVTGSQNRYAGIFGSLEFIHRGQWLPSGGTLMGLGALSVVLILGLGGVFLWWPRSARRFGRGFVIDRRLKGPAFTLVLHRTTGAWVVIFLMMSALTGLPNAFDGIRLAMIRAGVPESVPPLASVPPSGVRPKPLALDKVWNIVKSLSPEPREVLIPLTRHAPTDPLELFIIAADAPHANARTYVDLDAYSGKVLKFTPYRDSGIWAKIYYFGLSLHTGKIGGIMGDLCLFIGAIGALVLGVTGIQSFGGRLLRRNAKLATAGRAVPASIPTPSSTTAR